MILLYCAPIIKSKTPFFLKAIQTQMKTDFNLGVKVHIGILILNLEKKQLTSYLKFVEAVSFVDNPNSAVKPVP